MNESRATRYQRLSRRGRAAALASAGVVLAAIAFTPAARVLARVADRMGGGATGGPLALVALVVLLVVLWELAALPAMLFLGLRVDRVYGRAGLTVEHVLGAQASATMVALPAALVAAAAVWLTTRLSAHWWWLTAGLLLTAASAAALRGAPAVLAWLAEVRPLARGALRARVLDLARRSRVSIAGIDEWLVGDGTCTTALVTGIGRARRVLVSSEVVKHWSDDEIAVVVAHELAHHVYRDLWFTLGLDAGVLVTAFGISDAVVRRMSVPLGLAGPGDLEALPLMALVAGVVWLTATPLRHAQSRRQERRADVFALATTGHAEAFGAAIRRLGARHLAEERPSAVTRWLFHSHPSVSERLALAETYLRARSQS